MAQRGRLHPIHFYAGRSQAQEALTEGTIFLVTDLHLTTAEVLYGQGTRERRSR